MGIFNAAVSGINSTGVTLTWQTTTPNADTEALIGIVDEGGWHQGRIRSGHPDSDTHVYVITGLVPGSHYRIAASSFDSQEANYLPVDDGSSPLDFDTPPLPVPIPPSHNSFLATPTGSTSNRLTWVALVDPSASFQVYRNTVDDFYTAETIGSPLEPGTSLYNDYGVDPGTQYYYWLAQVG